MDFIFSTNVTGLTGRSLGVDGRTDGRLGDVRQYGKMSNNLQSLEKPVPCLGGEKPGGTLSAKPY